jgi:cytochrome P450
VFIPTGVLTSSSALRAFFLAMLHHGDVQGKIQNEVDLIIGHDRAPSLTDRAYMPYTEAAILETLRLGCISPLGVGHSVTEDVTFRGYAISRDSMVNYINMSVLVKIHACTHAHTQYD